MLDPRKDKFKTIQNTIPTAIHYIERDYGVDLLIERRECTSDEIIKLTRYEAQELIKGLTQIVEHR